MSSLLKIDTLIPVNLLNNPLASCTLIHFGFLLSQTAHFDKRIIPLIFVFKTFGSLLFVFFLHFKHQEKIVFMYNLNFYLSLEFLIFPFISQKFLSALFIKTIFESIQALKIKTPMLLNLDFASNVILSCFFFLFLIIDSYFFIPAVITQIFNPTEELGNPIGIPFKEVKAEMKTHPVTIEIKISKC